MPAISLIYSFGKDVLDSSLKKESKLSQNDKNKEYDNQIVEKYEGYCEDCDTKDSTPQCLICRGI